MRIISALVRKEFLQIRRDISSIIISFVLPVLLFLIYMYAINLDTARLRFGLKIDDASPAISSLAGSFTHSRYAETKIYDDKELMYGDIRRGKINGAVIIPNDFSSRLKKGEKAGILVITDGSNANIANFAQSYPVNIVNGWLASNNTAGKIRGPVQAEVRTWFNQSLNSHYFILPASLAVTMTLIGLLLTALVISREWERGTMEALLSTRVTKLQILMGKYIPFFILGMMSMAFNVFMCIVVFKIPFHGSLTVFTAVSALFLLTSIGIGLFISTVTKNQLLASEAAIGGGFLPSLFLSGLLFPINSMPLFFQYFTLLLPPRHFVSFASSEFMAGTVWSIVSVSSAYLAALSVLLFALVYKKTKINLD